MNILYAASEAMPYAKSGGLGDVAGSLPVELTKIKGTKAAVIMPYYGKIKNNPELDIEYVGSFSVPLAWTSLPNSYLSVSHIYFLFLLRLVLYAVLLGKAYCHHNSYLSFTILYHILLYIPFIKLSGSVGSVFYIFFV